MNGSYFLGSWLGTPAHPGTTYILEVTFQENNQVVFALSEHHVYNGSWKFDSDTQMLTFYSTDQRTPASTFIIEKSQPNSFDLVGITVKITTYFMRANELNYLKSTS